MYQLLKFDPKGPAPTVSLDLLGGLRIRYHLSLLDPSGGGEVVKEWRGNNWDKEKDEFDLPLKGNALKFAGLIWHFDLFPNPGVSGQIYQVAIKIVQGGVTTSSKSYSSSISEPEIISEDGVFVAV